MTTIAINGFGRIGRLVFRALVEQGHLGKTFNVVAVGDIVPADNLAYLLKYDSTQGRFNGTVSSKKSSPDLADDDIIVVNGHDIKVVSARTPDGLPWKEMGVEIVIESTGLFTDAEKAKGHITAGAKKVIISAPAKGEDGTFVRHRHRGRPDDHRPLLHRHAEDRGRSFAQGLEGWPHRRAQHHPVHHRRRQGGRAGLPGSEGQAHRHGLPLLKKASETYLKGILEYTEDEVVSTDFIHSAASSIFDAGSSIELNSRFFKLISWYDNEWGYSNRVIDLLHDMVKKGI